MRSRQYPFFARFNALMLNEVRERRCEFARSVVPRHTTNITNSDGAADLALVVDDGDGGGSPLDEGDEGVEGELAHRDSESGEKKDL